jgi:hypothetical protein
MENNMSIKPKTFIELREENGWNGADEELEKILEAMASRWPKSAFTELRIEEITFHGNRISFPGSAWITWRNNNWNQQFPVEIEHYFFCEAVLNSAYLEFLRDHEIEGISPLRIGSMFL